jgi:DNA-binding LacI/PurR family transcriptional regulator
MISRAYPISPATTREKVKKIAQQFNYQPNALVRSIQSGKTMMIGMVCNHFTNIHAGMIMSLCK